MKSQTVEDASVGLVEVRVSDDGHRVSVTGESIYEAVLERAQNAPVDKHVPVGTRVADHLTFTVRGMAFTLKPGPGRLRRRSYRVQAEHMGAVHELVPSGDGTSTLVHNGTSLGILHVDEAGDISAEWSQTPSEVDAAVGYCLAVAFGTGAKSAVGALVDSINDLFPG